VSETPPNRDVFEIDNRRSDWEEAPWDQQVSISSTFYEQLFCLNVFFEIFLQLEFGFVIFWQNNICAKAARKMFGKLTTGTILDDETSATNVTRSRE